MIQNLLNFVEEETLLQTNAYKIVERIYYIIVYRKPKIHPKISGEVIEYSWVCEKNYYRHLSLDKKKGNTNKNKSPRGHIKIQPYQKDSLYVL